MPVRCSSLIRKTETRIYALSSFCYISSKQTVGRSRISTHVVPISRKVRAPVDRLPGNAWA
jgi:hypothetical protein